MYLCWSRCCGGGLWGLLYSHAHPYHPPWQSTLCFLRCRTLSYIQCIYLGTALSHMMIMNWSSKSISCHLNKMFSYFRVAMVMASLHIIETLRQVAIFWPTKEVIQSSSKAIYSYIILSLLIWNKCWQLQKSSCWSSILFQKETLVQNISLWAKLEPVSLSSDPLPFFVYLFVFEEAGTEKPTVLLF